MNGDRIASLVISKYNSLPNNGKPLIRSNGVKEWTILAGIVVHNTSTDALECVALGTGVKACSEAIISDCKGQILHDCHAEILAIRAFNLYIIENGQENIGDIYLYISAPPCGDASMSLLNGGEDWSKGDDEEKQLIRGRAHYNRLGVIRTKPGRVDSQLTMSKSCSDKLCLRQTRGLLLSPVKYLNSVNVPDAPDLFLTALVSPVVLPDFHRAFTRWNPIHPFKYLQTNIVFPGGNDADIIKYASLKSNNEANTNVELTPTTFDAKKTAPSPLSIVWTPDHREVIANGIKQGSKKTPSIVSRFKIAELVCSATNVHPKLYSGFKAKSCSWPAGWIRTSADDFEL